MPGYLGGWHKENTNPCLEFESTNVIEVWYCEHEHFYHTMITSREFDVFVCLLLVKPHETLLSPFCKG